MTHWALALVKGNREPHEAKKESFDLGGTEPTTSGLDVPSLFCHSIFVPSATRHNIHMHPYFLFAAIHHLQSSPTFSVRPCSSVGRVTEDLIRRSWARFPPRSKYFFFASCGSLFPFTRANAQWVIHGFNLHFRVNSLFHYIYKRVYKGLQRYGKAYMGLQGYTRVYKRLQEVYKGIQGITGEYMGIQG